GCASGTQIFVHDRATGTTTCVSVDGSGVPGNGNSFSPALSADGQVVAFQSLATNLVPSDTNGVGDIFIARLGCAGPAFVIGPTSMSPTTIAQGSTGTIQTQICSSSAADHVLIDLEIYDSSNTKLAQMAFPGQSFTPGETKSYGWPYFVDVLRPDGIYTVK